MKNRLDQYGARGWFREKGENRSHGQRIQGQRVPLSLAHAIELIADSGVLQPLPDSNMRAREEAESRDEYPGR